MLAEGESSFSYHSGLGNKSFLLPYSLVFKRFTYRILPETLSWLSGEWQSYNVRPTPTSFLVGEGGFILHSPKVRCSTRSALFQEGFFWTAILFLVCKIVLTSQLLSKKAQQLMWTNKEFLGNSLTFLLHSLGQLTRQKAPFPGIFTCRVCLLICAHHKGATKLGKEGGFVTSDRSNLTISMCWKQI